jgi:hypothetical protein
VYVYTRSGTTWSQEAYIKASTPGLEDAFGTSIDLSADGNTLAVGAENEDSNATTVNGDQANDLAPDAGALFIFNRTGQTWSQQAYIKASNAEAGDNLGGSLSLSNDGNTVVVSAVGESSNAADAPANNAAVAAGATYVFTRSGTTWTQQAYIKASNPSADDEFGNHITLSGVGDTLAIGAMYEDSNAIGINGDEIDGSFVDSGAVYVFTRSGTAWAQQAYLKASNTGAGDEFGGSLDLNSDGNILAIGARKESSKATGINGDQSDDTSRETGAVYMFTRSGTTWSQQAYIKASNSEVTSAAIGEGDHFHMVSLSADGKTLATGAYQEGGNAIGSDGDQTNNLALKAGAVYLY